MKNIEKIKIRSTISVAKPRINNYIEVETNLIYDMLSTHNWYDLTGGHSRCKDCNAEISIHIDHTNLYLTRNKYNCYSESEKLVKDIIE